MTQENQEGGGINVQTSDAQIPPRPPVDDGEATTAAGADENPKGKKSGTKKVPLSPNVVKFPILTGSRAIAEITEYPRFAFTDEEAKTLAEAIADLGLELTPAMNVILLAAGMVAGKTMGYVAWRRSGKPPLEADGSRRPRQHPPVQAPPSQPSADDLSKLSSAEWEAGPDDSEHAGTEE